MWLTLRALLLCLLPASAWAGPVEGWLLNGLGAATPYAVYRLSPDGKMADPTLIIAPGGAVAQVYWPSGVKVGGATYVYATVQDGAGQQKIGRWVSTGGAFSSTGVVLSPQAGESGIGSQTVLYDPDDTSAPFKMWFGVSGAGDSRPTMIKYATSPDGVTWTRQATVLTASEPYESAGFQLDFVCRDAGVWRLFYSATANPVSQFSGVEATSGAPGGPFIKRGVVLNTSGAETSVSTTIQRGTRYLEVASTTGLVAGHVYVLSDGTNIGTQRIVIEKVINGTAISLSGHAYVAGSGFKMRPADMRKAGISAFYRDGNGVGRGLATGWGAFDSVANEFTFRVVEGVSGFTRDPDAPQPFTPVGPGSLNSFENPSPIMQGPDCPVWNG